MDVNYFIVPQTINLKHDFYSTVLCLNNIPFDTDVIILKFANSIGNLETHSFRSAALIANRTESHVGTRN